MKMYIRVNKHGNLEETLSVNGELKNAPPLATVNAYYQEYHEQNSAETGVFDPLKVYDRLGIAHPEETRPEDCALFISDLVNAFHFWLFHVPENRQTPSQRFRIRIEAVEFAIDIGVKKIQYMSRSAEEKRMYLNNAALSQHSAYHTMAYYLDRTSSRPVPFVKQQKKIRTQAWETNEKYNKADEAAGHIEGDIKEDKEGKPIKRKKQNTNTINTFARLYQAQPEGGLLALAWAEIAYCLEGEITFKICGHGREDRGCGKIYQPSRDRKVFCSKKCTDEAFSKRSH